MSRARRFNQVISAAWRVFVTLPLASVLIVSAALCLLSSPAGAVVDEGNQQYAAINSDNQQRPRARAHAPATAPRPAAQPSVLVSCRLEPMERFPVGAEIAVGERANGEYQMTVKVGQAQPLIEIVKLERPQIDRSAEDPIRELTNMFGSLDSVLPAREDIGSVEVWRTRQSARQFISLSRILDRVGRKVASFALVTYHVSPCAEPASQVESRPESGPDAGL